MAHRWYYERNRQRFGPYSGAELKELASAGELRPQDTVWQEGIAKGSLASRVKYLFDPPAATAVVKELPSPAPAPTTAAEADSPARTDMPAFPDDATLISLVDSPALVPAKPPPA